MLGFKRLADGRYHRHLVILEAQKLNPDSAYDVIEFEQDNPTLVIPRAELDSTNTMIAARYGVTEMVHVKP